MATILVIGNAKETNCLASRLSMDCHVKTCILNDPTSPDWRKIYPDGLDAVVWMNEAKPEIQERFKSVPTFGGLAVLQDTTQAIRVARLLTPDLISICTQPSAPLFTVGGFFTGRRFVGYHYFTIHTRLMEGNKGPLTTGMGAIIFQNDLPYYQTVLEPLTPLLEKARYVGPVWANLSYDTVVGNPFLLSYRTDVDYLGMYAFLSLCRRGPARFIQDILDDKNPDLYDGLAGAVRLSTSPWPHKRAKPDIAQGTKVQFPEAAKKHIYFADDYDLLGYVTARGEDIQEVRRRLYRTINGNCHKDVQYRRDVGRDIWTLEYFSC